MTMIEINEYKSFPDRTFGLGQDVSQDLSREVEVASLFVPTSKIYAQMVHRQLQERTTEAGANQSVLDELLTSLVEQKMTYKTLISVNIAGKRGTSGRTPYATGLIRALFRGQRNPAITDWAAANYLSVAVGLGLLDFDYETELFTITQLGREAVTILDQGNKRKLDTFLLERLYEYPYAAWLIRLMNKKENRGKAFSKYELGEQFGFIDEPGFISLPEEIYVDLLARAEASGDRNAVKDIRSNFESTADKYMRWLTGVFVKYNLLKCVKKEIKTTLLNGKQHTVSLQAYKATGLCIIAQNYVNGGSSHHRSVKRIRWEYLAPKSTDAPKRKTIRALALKFLSEKPSGLDYTTLANNINAIIPELHATPSMLQDDIEGLTRIGIDIKSHNGSCILKDTLTDFIIPVEKNQSFKNSVSVEIIERIRPYLTHIDHKYLKAIGIAYKSHTSNAENTELEQLATSLFIHEMEYCGTALGGPNKPDGLIYTDDELWILDTKAYAKGFTVTRDHTDPMARYINEYRNRRGSHNKSGWFDLAPEQIPAANAHFMYVSGFFSGEYKKQLNDFENNSVNMRGSLMEITKLILLAEKYKRGEISHQEISNYALDNNITFNQYFPELTKGW